MSHNYYDLLGLAPDASPAEIKRAFRARVKRTHPDLNPGNQEATQRMRELIRAYETLINPVLRDEYDQAASHHRGGEPFDYRSFLKQQGDAGSLSRLVFYDLLHGLEDWAVKQYHELLRLPGYSLRAHFEREDFMDCAYILAEELLRLGDPEEACRLFLQISQLELEKPYFRFFFAEVVQHLRQVLAVSPASAIPNDRFIIYLEKAIQAGFSAKDTAFFMKSAAEWHLRRNQRPKALFYLHECLRLDPRIGGVKELRRKLHA